MTKCCVEGCEKTFVLNSKNFKNDDSHPVHSISFHRFPRKKALRQKWLNAIGRPKWDVPSTAHVCSQHFSSQQLDYVNNSLHGIKDDGYPDSALPIVPCSSVKASNLKVCRFCLATNIKMFSLQSGVLKTCLETIAGLHENHNVDGLPQYLCFICSAYLLKMYNVIERSMIAQATLLEIYAENFEITKKLVYEQNRQKLHLVHTLESHSVTPGAVFDYVYDDEQNVSVLVTGKLESHKQEDENSFKQSGSGDTTESESELRAKQLNKLCRKLKNDIDQSEDLLTELYDEPFDLEDIPGAHNISGKSKVTHSNTLAKLESKHYNDIQNNNKDTDEKPITREYIIRLQSSDSDYADIQSENENSLYIKDHSYLHTYVSDNEFTATPDDIVKSEYRAIQENNNEKCISFSSLCDSIQITDVKSLVDEDKAMESESSGSVTKTSVNKHEYAGEPCLNDYYNIAELNLDEQKQQWIRSTAQPTIPLDSYECGVCRKWVRCGQYYLNHVARHDLQCGDYECEVCKVRFAKEHLLKKHVLMIHSRKYSCKMCPSDFYNRTAATKHRLKHEKKPHYCARCDRSFSSRTGLRVHMASTHHSTLHWKSPSQYACQACDLRFTSIVTLREHRSMCDAIHSPSLLEGTSMGECNECGQQCSTREQLDAHKRNVHGQTSSVRRAKYPAKCNHCDLILKNRAHQCGHMFVTHPETTAKYHKDPRRSVRLERKVQAAVSSRESKHSREKDASIVRSRSNPRPPGRLHVKRNERRILSTATRRKLKKVPPTEVIYECPICDNVFTTTASLNRHILDVHQRLQFERSATLSEGRELTEVNSVREFGDVAGIVHTGGNPSEKADDISLKVDSETDTCSKAMSLQETHYDSCEDQ